MGGSGGGALRINISNTLTLDGTLSANGTNGSSGNCWGGGGGGGAGSYNLNP